MYRMSLLLVMAVLASLMATPESMHAQVQRSSSTGFTIELKRELGVSPEIAYATMVNDFSKWYDASHSYGQKAEKLSLDLERSCMLEVLEGGGFVRHMEIVFHQPGKMLRLTGGLGPLQGMGVSGAWTFSFAEKEGGKTELKMTYAVSGAEFLQLDRIAIPVSQVLSGQMDRLQSYCNTGRPTSGNTEQTED